MYRLAETLLRAGDYDTNFEAKIAPFRNREQSEQFYWNMIDWKPTRQFGPKKTPRVLLEFFNYCLGLTYYEEPNYNYWIKRFGDPDGQYPPVLRPAKELVYGPSF
jgi:hypothetical protein